MLGSRLAYEKRFMSLTFFFFFSAAIIGMLDLYFVNILFLIISASCFIAGFSSLFFTSVFVQLAILILSSGLFFAILLTVNSLDRNEVPASERLKRQIGKKVVVHEWMDNRFAKVQFDGKVWEAEIAYTSGESLTPGQYKIWKILPNRLVLIRA